MINISREQQQAKKYTDTDTDTQRQHHTICAVKRRNTTAHTDTERQIKNTTLRDYYILISVSIPHIPHTVYIYYYSSSSVYIYSTVGILYM